MATRRLEVILDVDTGRASARLKDAGRSVREFGLETQRAGQQVHNAGRYFDTMDSSLRRPLNKLRDYVLVLGNLRFALLNIRDLSVGWVVGLMKQSAELERLTILMKGFSKASSEAGKSREARENLRDIMDMARKTGFEMKALTDAFVKFESADLNPQVYSIRGLTQAVAKFGGDSDTLHRASIAIQQMSGKGVISMEELRQQLGEAVPTAMKTLAGSLGMTVREMVKAISKGRVAAKPALELMLRDMEITSAGAGQRIANSMFGQLAQVRTNMLNLAADFTQLGEGENGFFAQTVSQLKELNAAMQSGEGQAAVRSFGESVGALAASVGEAIKWLVEWRNAIGGVLITLLKLWAGMKAIQIGAWFAKMGISAITALNAVRSGAREMTGVSGEMARAGDRLVTSINNQRAAAQQWIQRTQQRVQVARQSIDATQQEIEKLRDLRTTYSQNIQILTQQRQQQMANLRTAQTLNEANVAQGRSTVQSMEMVKREQDAVNASTRSLINTRRLLQKTDAELIVAEEQLQLALTEETAAVARATVAEEANATASGLMATAARGAGLAVQFLGEFINVALGPIGLFLIACQSLEQWLYADANAAAAATKNLRDFVGAMATVEKVKAAQKELESVNTALGENPNASFWDKLMHRNLDPTQTDDLKRRQKELQSYITNESGNAFMNQGREDAAGISYQMQNYHDMLVNKKEFADKWNSLSERILAGDKSAVKEQQALRDRVLQMQRSALQNTINDAQKKLDRARATGNKNAEARLSGTLSALNQQMQTLSQSGASVDLVSEALNGKGKGGGLAGAAAAAGRRVGNLRGDIAALEAQVSGDKSTHIQKFMAALAGGAYAGKGQDEISLLRRKALLQDQAADMRSAESAGNRYKSMLSSMTGRLAELNDELTGGKGNLAKFEAQLAAGKFADFDPQWIETLRQAAKSLDETEQQVDVKKVFDDLDKGYAKASTEADEMWKSFNAGTFEADQRLAQLKSRFADNIIGLKGQDLRDAQQQITNIVQEMQRADAAKQVFDWSQESQKILNGLLDENAAREANYQLEVERQRSLINWAVLSVEERKQAEINFERWKRAFRMQTDRENENSVLKMARQWTQLGQGIQQVMADSLKSIVDGLADANINVGKFIEDLVKQIFKMILMATIAYGILSALGMTNNAAGQPVSYGQFLRGQLSAGFSNGGTPAGSEIGYKAGTHHTGGVIGAATNFKTVSASMFASAFKYHGGGMISKLGPKEVPMIGLEGERVLTEEDQRELASRGGAPQVTVNVINNSGTDVDAEAGHPEFNGREWVLGVVLEAAQKPGAFRDVLQNTKK